MFTRIQWRIAASYVVLIAIVLLALGAYLVSYLWEQQLNVLEAQLTRQALLVADNVQHRLAVEGPGGLDQLAKDLGRDINGRVTLIARDGTVLGDSDADPRTMDNHGTRPEVLQALQRGTGESQRHSDTLDEQLLYVAVAMREGSAVTGFARVALPVQVVEEAINRVVAAVAAAMVAAAMLAVLAAIVVARMTARPIQGLTASARRLAFGELNETMPVHGRDEVSQLSHAFNEMAARLRAQLQAVDDERARLAIVLGHMAHGLVITDQDGTVRMINPTAAALLQVAPERAEGRSVMAVLRDHELSALVQAAVEGKAPGAPRVLELGPAGSRRIVEAMASRIPGAGGIGSQVLLVLQDVTEVRRADTVRREFVANVSHELRTPVASLKALAETLAGGAVDDGRVAKDFLARMEIEIDGLAQLVEELLELTRIESGQVALRLESADLARVIAAAAERLRPQAERQGVELQVRVPNTLPEVRADPDRIVQVVVNLVHNAVKFTPPGGRVEVNAERRDGRLAVTVADTGAGIPEDALPRLFERFYKTDPARTGTGTGLGLAIVKHIVQAHGGEVSVESREGEGSRFSFTIPLNEP
jgi:two-component system phosphate regulon sensor histidine kinase PhoR